MDIQKISIVLQLSGSILGDQSSQTLNLLKFSLLAQTIPVNYVLSLSFLTICCIYSLLSRGDTVVVHGFTVCSFSPAALSTTHPHWFPPCPAVLYRLPRPVLEYLFRRFRAIMECLVMNLLIVLLKEGSPPQDR